MAEQKTKRTSELETQLLEKVSSTISAINSADTVDDVILALHSLASLIFSIHPSSLSGVVSERYRDQLKIAECSSACERSELWEVFYRGAAFPTLARFLIYDVASNWLSCIPITARKLVYDVFFVKGLTIEVVQTVIPTLDRNTTGAHDANAVRSNVERLVELCLLENEGVLHLAREFGAYHESGNNSSSALKLAVSRVAQLVASVPDKARIGAQRTLSSRLFFKNITVQLIAGVEERSLKVHGTDGAASSADVDGTFQFVGEMFARICRRGSADLLLSEMTPQILRGVQSFLSSNSNTNVKDCFITDVSYQFWFLMIEIIKDAYVVERIAEQILHQLVTERANDTEAYWVLWILFHRSFEQQTSIRNLFLEKFLLWKIFPLRCLRWILQFAVFCCPPCGDNLKKSESSRGLLDAVQRVIAVWSKQEFVQSAPLEQQVYVTAAAGLLLENMSREELDSLKDVMRSVLGGVSCRLENPDELVRRMASSIALVFSKIVDPNNPLYLDDSIREGDIDWEFGLAIQNKGGLSTTSRENKKSSIDLVETTEPEHEGINERGSKVNVRKKKSLDYKLVDPDEVIDPATLNDELVFGEDQDEDDDNASEDSEASSDSSLQPYDLTDDDSDLRRKFSQLVDVIAALRKSDDPEGVERAVDVAEKLIRAAPDELRHVASDLVRTLVNVRVSDATVEGEEESAEEKRQKALVALLVTCPFESVDSMNKLLYSPHLDVSQRIMILDAMTDAAQELANTKTIIQKNKPGPLISSASEPQPWFLPSSTGPPGAGSWKEVSDSVTPLSWTHRYARELPLKPGQIKKGKTRKWGHKMESEDIDRPLNKFPLFAAAFMLPAMQGFDKKRHGVDLISRDFIVLGKLIYMLGVCIKCTTLHPEAFALAPALLDMLSSREVCHHKEAYVRRAVLFAVSCTLTALHPSFIASALLEGNLEVSRGLEWARSWALEVAESDPDRECYSMAMTCLQLHAEMSFQASRALESAETTLKHKSVGIPLDLSKGIIKIPGSSGSFLS